MKKFKKKIKKICKNFPMLYRFILKIRKKKSFLSKVRYIFKMLIIILKHPKRLLSSKIKEKELISEEIIFVCEANYHIRNAAIIIRNLSKNGISSGIIDMTKHLGGGKRTLNQSELEEYSDIKTFVFQKDTYQLIDRTKLKIAIFFNDWGANHKFIRQLRIQNIKTIGIDEGVNDFLKLGEGFTSKISPYRTCEYVVLPGEYDTKFFDDRPGQYFVSGLPMIRKLYNEEITSPKKPLAVINVNFTYSVLTYCREEFLQTAVEGCKIAGIDYVLTQHPMDMADLSEYNVTDKDMYDTIREGSIFISRFSGAIIESLAMGKPCVYHNPHDEKILKFQEPLGAYSISDSAKSLAEAIKTELKKSERIPVREYSKEFMNLHANIDTKEEPQEIITKKIIELIED